MASFDWKPIALEVDKDGQALVRRYSEMKANAYVIMAMRPGTNIPHAIKADFTTSSYRSEAKLWAASEVEIILEQLRQRNPGWRFSKCPDYWINCRDVRRVDLGGVECFDSKAPPEDANWTVYVRHHHEGNEQSGSIGFISAEGKGIVRFADMIRFTTDEIDDVLIQLRSLNPDFILDKYYIRKDRIQGVKSVSERFVGLSPIVPKWLYKYPIGRQSFPGDTFLIECRPGGSKVFRPAFLTPRGWRENDPMKAAWFGYQSVDLSKLMPFLFDNNPGWYFRFQSVVIYNPGNASLLKDVGVFKSTMQKRKMVVDE